MKGQNLTSKSEVGIFCLACHGRCTNTMEQKRTKTDQVRGQTSLDIVNRPNHNQSAVITLQIGHSNSPKLTLFLHSCCIKDVRSLPGKIVTNASLQTKSHLFSHKLKICDFELGCV